MDKITKEDIKKSFGESNLHVFDDKEEMLNFIKQQDWHNKNLLMMTSGTFNGLDYKALPDMLN